MTANRGPLRTRPDDGNAEPIPDADLPPGESLDNEPQATDDIGVPGTERPAEPAEGE